LECIFRLVFFLFFKIWIFSIFAPISQFSQFHRLWTSRKSNCVVIPTLKNELCCETVIFHNFTISQIHNFHNFILQLRFKPCLELPAIDNAKWECTQYNLLYSQCKIKCNSGFKFIGDANARKICELYEDTKASDTKARFQIAITV